MRCACCGPNLYIRMSNCSVRYWPFATANRLDTSASLLHLITAPEKRATLRANAPIAFQHDSLAGPEGHSSFWMLNDPYLNDKWAPNSQPSKFTSIYHCL